jgi:hypothetical protein
MVLKDYFKVTRLLPIHQSNLLIALEEDTGLLIFNLTAITSHRLALRVSEILIAEINLPDKEYTPFYRQQERVAPLKVQGISGNLPHELTVITNFGIFTLEFPVDLTDIAAISTMGVTKSFTPESVRQLMLEYDAFNGHVVSNKYGSAFLIYNNLQGRNFDVQLVAMSYYSAPNSRLFKFINITWNEECISLNQDSYFEFTPEDQLAVSFICGAYL